MKSRILFELLKAYLHFILEGGVKSLNLFGFQNKLKKIGYYL